MAKGKKDTKKKSGDKFSGYDGVVDDSKKEETLAVEAESEIKVDDAVKTDEAVKIEEDKIDAPVVKEEKKVDVVLEKELPVTDSKQVKVKFLKECPRLFIINGYVEGVEDESKYVTEPQATILKAQKFIA